MSREILKLVQKIDSSTVDLQMVLQCAPVLAGLKVSNMLSVRRAFYPRILEVLKQTDISCYLLRQTDEKVILLLYKEQELQQQLLEADTRAFLKSYGYTQFAVEDVLDLFKKRYCDNLCTTKDFPHEMGVLLGYPLEDVKGFINNRGRNFLYTGYWKVYSDLQQKMDLFGRFEQAKEQMIRLLSYGMDIQEIIMMFHYEELREAVI